MYKISPVEELKQIPIDKLAEMDDWDIQENPESAFLSIPENTISNLLDNINKYNLWNDFYRLAEKKSDQWRIDLAHFFPNEEKFVLALYEIFSMQKTEHGLLVFCQECSNWKWSAETVGTLRKTIQKIIAFKASLSDQKIKIVGSNLDKVIEDLTRKAD